MNTKVAITISLIGILLIASLFAVGKGLKPLNSPSDATQIEFSQSNSPPTLATTTPAGYVSYTSTKYQYSLSYPPYLHIKEYEESGGAHTVIFQDPDTNAGFQIYVVPFSGTHISKARFLLDESSGVMINPTDIMIDGTRATMFFGKNSIMGETREVWFIHGGYLYEVTTYKELDSWLAGILGTFHFLATSATTPI